MYDGKKLFYCKNFIYSLNFLKKKRGLIMKGKVSSIAGDCDGNNPQYEYKKPKKNMSNPKVAVAVCPFFTQGYFCIKKEKRVLFNTNIKVYRKLRFDYLFLGMFRVK
jgi:hypothetical protein